MKRYMVWYRTFAGPACAEVRASNPQEARRLVRKALANQSIVIGDVVTTQPG